MTQRIVLATALLIVGVGLVAASAETSTVGLAVAGYLLMLFVPALIVDEIKRGLGR